MAFGNRNNFAIARNSALVAREQAVAAAFVACPEALLPQQQGYWAIYQEAYRRAAEQVQRQMSSPSNNRNMGHGFVYSPGFGIQE